MQTNSFIYYVDNLNSLTFLFFLISLGIVYFSFNLKFDIHAAMNQISSISSLILLVLNLTNENRTISENIVKINTPKIQISLKVIIFVLYC